MAASDARPIPKKNVAYRHYFSILDADGDPVAGVVFHSGIDAARALLSKDGGTGVSSTNDITEIVSVQGCYYIELTATEMNFDSIVILARATDPPGTKHSAMFIYPQEAGDIQVQVNSLDADVITAASIAANAIGSSELADNAITSTKLAANSIGSTHLQTDAIGGAQLASSAVTEIQAGLALATNLSTLQSDVTNLSTRLPAALVSGRMDSSIGAVATDAITSTSLAASAAAEIAQAVWDFLTASAVTANSFGVLVKTNLDATITSRPAGSDYSPTRAGNLDNADVATSTRSTPADVLAQAAASFGTATVPALGVGVPQATPTIAQALSLVYMMYRNRQVVTTTEVKLYADDGTTVVTKWPHSEVASVYDRLEALSGP